MGSIPLLIDPSGCCVENRLQSGDGGMGWDRADAGAGAAVLGLGGGVRSGGK